MSNKELSESLLPYANAFSAANGLVLESRNKQDDVLSFKPAPISLLPQVFPKSAFEQGQSIATDINVLMHKIACDYKFLEKSLQGVDVDFTGKLLEMFQDIYLSEEQEDFKKSCAKKADRLGILRSDYMLSSPSNTLKQIECNTIASSFAGLAVNVAKLHGFLTKRFKSEIRDFMQVNKEQILKLSSSNEIEGVTPPNPAVENVAKSMYLAQEQYKSRYGQTSSNLCILFIVQEGETNTIDQRLLELALFQNHQIPVQRLSLKQCQAQCIVCPKTGALLYDGNEISLVYFRAGYTPRDYPSSVEWEGRRILEMNRAIKCPNLPFHLAGTKKVQQLIANPAVLKQFITDDAKREKVQEVFAGLYTLSQEEATEEDFKAILDAMTESGSQNYVLKPQREGGGNNYYSNEMIELLKQFTEKTNKNEDGIKLLPKLKEFILMERLFPPQQLGILLRDSKVQAHDAEQNVAFNTISELGMFGTILCSMDKEEVLHNEYAGYLLRTKFVDVDEGGVASGFATLSSPYLC